jgi:DNA (cytosine-5)-methyltransferase 1
MNELALFAGAGGGILAGKLLGWRTICAVEWEPYTAGILTKRQNEKVLEAFPIWDDIQTFDGRPWKGIIDVVSGGFPCQDISAAGKGTGLSGERSSMWFHMLRVAKEIQPKYIWIENSPLLRTRGLHIVLQGLHEAGYNAAWGVLSAEDCGANHQRKRMWILAELADTEKLQCNGIYNYTGSSLETEQKSKSGNSSRSKDVPFTNGVGRSDCNKYSTKKEPTILSSPCPRNSRKWYETEPDVGRVADGVASRMDRLKAIGNGQVPIVAATAFLQLQQILKENKQ